MKWLQLCVTLFRIYIGFVWSCTRCELALSPKQSLAHNEFPSRVPHDLSNATTRRPTCIFVITIIITPYTYHDKLRRSIINCQLCLFCLFCYMLDRTSLAQLSFMFCKIPKCGFQHLRAHYYMWYCVLALHSNWVRDSLLLCSIVIHLGCIVP